MLILASSGKKALLTHTSVCGSNRTGWKKSKCTVWSCVHTQRKVDFLLSVLSRVTFLFHSTHEPKLNSFAPFIQLATHERPAITGHHKSFTLNTIRLFPCHINICSLSMRSCLFRSWLGPTHFFCWFVDCCWHVLCGSGWLPGWFSKNTPQACTDRWHSLSAPSHKPTTSLLIWLL